MNGNDATTNAIIAVVLAAEVLARLAFGFGSGDAAEFVFEFARSVV